MWVLRRPQHVVAVVCLEDYQVVGEREEYQSMNYVTILMNIFSLILFMKLIYLKDNNNHHHIISTKFDFVL